MVWREFTLTPFLRDEVLRYPGEDDSYEKPKMDALGL